MTARFTVRLWIAFVAFCVGGYLEHAYLTRFGFVWVRAGVCFDAGWNGRVVSPRP